MESEIQGTLLSVSSRQTKTGKTIYDFALDNGNTYVTFKGSLFTKAQALQGQQVSARVKVEQNGDFVNYYLNDIAPQGQLAPASGPVATTAPPVQKAPSTFNGGMTPEREQKIVKQSSLATAFRYAASAGLSEQEAVELAARIYFRVMGEPFEGVDEPVAVGATESPSDGVPW